MQPSLHYKLQHTNILPQNQNQNHKHPRPLPLAHSQVVQAKGATVVATAGGPAKRALLHALGARHVLGSRETQFASEVAELGGVDIVLNSLTSAGMVAGSLAALNLGGRFCEISKRDIWSPARMAQGEGGLHGTLAPHVLELFT